MQNSLYISSSEARLFIKRLAVFLIPIIFIAVPVIMSGLIWPVDKFTARALEALIIHGVDEHVAQFIPEKELTVTEYPDQMFYDHRAIKKVNKWVIDASGYRNFPRPMPRDGYDIVITGASNIYGSYYDQNDTISEVLIRKCGCTVYNLGTPASSKQTILFHKFKNQPPKAAVFAVRRREFPTGAWDWDETITDDVPPASRIQVVQSQLRKVPLFQYVRARLGTSVKANYRYQSEGDASDDPLLNAKQAEQVFSQFTNQLPALKDKITIYVHPTGLKSDVFVEELRKKDLSVVAVPYAGHAIKGISGRDNYWLEQDSHWRSATIELAANLILQNLARKNQFFSASEIKKRKETDWFNDWLNATNTAK